MLFGVKEDGTPDIREMPTHGLTEDHMVEAWNFIKSDDDHPDHHYTAERKYVEPPNEVHNIHQQLADQAEQQKAAKDSKLAALEGKVQ